MNTVAERKRLSGILEIIVLKVVYGRIVPQRMIVENLTYVVFLTNAWTAVVLVVLRTRIAMSVYLTNMSVARRPFLSTKLSVAMIVSSCKSNDDCAGRGECCRSNKCVNTCDERSTPTPQNPTPTPQNQSPIHQPQLSGSSPGRTAGIAIAVLLVFGGVSIALIWYYKRKRPGNTIQVHRGTVALKAKEQ
jgi:hypothetical protein